MQTKETKKPVELLSKHLFWDIDPTVLEWDSNKKKLLKGCLKEAALKNGNI